MRSASAACRGFRRELHEHHDGAPASLALAGHLARCSCCRDLLLELAALDGSLTSSVEPLPAVLVRRLAATIPPRPEPLSRSLWALTLGSLAASVAAVLFAGDELAAPLLGLADWALQAPAAAASQALSPLLAWSVPLPSWLSDSLSAPASTLAALSGDFLSEFLQTSSITLTLSLPLILYPVGLVLAGSSVPARPRPRRRTS